jgi:hypothetical protein
MHVLLQLTELHTKALVRLIDGMSYDTVRTHAASDQMCYDIIIALEHLRAALEQTPFSSGEKGPAARIEEPQP